MKENIGPTTAGMRLLVAWHAKDSGNRVVQYRQCMGGAWSVSLYSKRSKRSMANITWYTTWWLEDSAVKAIAAYEALIGKRSK